MTVEPVDTRPRLLVVDEHEQLVGLVSADDVLELLIEELRNLGRIVGWSHPGIALPATEARSSNRRRADPAGLQRAATELEC